MWRRARAVLEPLAVAHFAGYPLAFVWAVAAIPLTIHLSIGALDALGGDQAAIGRAVVRRLAWPAGAVFLVAHLAAVPWLVATDWRTGQRRTLFALGVLAAVGVVAGAASWAWLFLR